jgi:hypothetical protein
MPLYARRDDAHGQPLQFLQGPARPQGKRWNDNTRTPAHELIL